MPSIEWWRNHTVKFTCKPHKYLKGKRIITKIQVKEKKSMPDYDVWAKQNDPAVKLTISTEERKSLEQQITSEMERRPKMVIFDKNNQEVVTVETLEKMYKTHKTAIANEVGQWLLGTVFPYMVMSGNTVEITLTKPRIAGCSDSMLISILAVKGFDNVHIDSEDNITITLPKEKFS